jgi:DNA repair protein SbcC/Rad50
MILESISLENWKKFRNPVEIQFKDGLNVLYGPNESGKTTLMESLRTTLFSKHSSKSKNIKSVIPWGSQLAPQARITFQNNGERYRITKTFIQPKSILEKWNNNWEKISEGDLADKAVTRIVGGELPRTGDTKSQNWGIGQCLWMVQGEPIISDELNDETFSSLQSMIGASIESEEEKEVSKLVSDLFSEFYTPTKKQKKGSSLSMLEGEIEDIKAEITGSKEKLIEKDELMRKLEDNEFMMGKKKQMLGESETQLLKLQKIIEKAQNHRRERETLQREVETLNNRYISLKNKVDEISQITDQINKLNLENDSLRADKQLQESGLKEVEGEIENIKQNIKHLKCSMEELSEEKKVASIAHTTVMREMQLEDKRSRLMDLKSLNHELESQENRYNSIKAPSRPQLNEIESLINCIRDTKTKLDAIGLNIQARGEFKGSIYLDGERFELENKNWKALQSVKIELDQGTIDIKSGNENVKLLKSQLEKMETELTRLTAPYDEKELEPLRELLNTKNSLETGIARIKADLDKKSEGGVDSIIREVAELEGKIERNWAMIPDDSPFKNCRDRDKNSVVEILSGKIQEIEEKVKTLKDNESEFEANMQALQDRHVMIDKCISHDETGIKSNDHFVEGSNERLRNLQKDGVTVEAMEVEQDQISLELEKKGRVLKMYQDEVLEKEDGPIKDYDAYDNQIKRIKEDVRDLELSHVRMETDLKNIKVHDINTLEESLKYKERTRKDLKIESDAVELLYDLTHHYKENTIVSLTDPIKKIVTEDLKVLGPRYSLEFDNKMKPCSVTPEGRDDEAMLDSLSFGTQEQVWCMFRLALGRLLSKDDKQLVVLDDPLVNTDPLRMHHALEILSESARDLQVVVVTCDVDKYNSLKDAAFISMENL